MTGTGRKKRKGKNDQKRKIMHDPKWKIITHFVIVYTSTRVPDMFGRNFCRYLILRFFFSKSQKFANYSTRNIPLTSTMENTKSTCSSQLPWQHTYDKIPVTNTTLTGDSTGKSISHFMLGFGLVSGFVKVFSVSSLSLARKLTRKARSEYDTA